MNRDDLNSLPIPSSAKEFSRRRGLRNMLPGNAPAAYTKMVADVTHQPVKGFRNKDDARTTSGKLINRFVSEAEIAPRRPYPTPRSNQERADMRERAKQLAQSGGRHVGLTRTPATGERASVALPQRAQQAADQAQAQQAADQAQAQQAATAQQQARADAEAEIAASNLQPDFVHDNVSGKHGIAVRLADAQIAANRILSNEKRRLSNGMRAAEANSYLAQLRSNSSKKVHSKFFQRLAGEDTKEHWTPVHDPSTGNMIGNASPEGYKLEVFFHTGRGVSTWEKIKSISGAVAGAASRAGQIIKSVMDV